MTRLNPIWIAVIYAVVSFIIVSTTMAVDPFAIFDGVYFWVTIGLPTFIVPGFIIYARIKHADWHWLLVVFGCLLCLGVSFLHVSLIAVASATV